MSAEADGGKGCPSAMLAFEDAALLERFRGGEIEAFAELVRKYQDRVFNAIFRTCGNRDDAEELSQETFVKALESLGGFRQASGFYTWLFRIAMNLTISRRRRAARVKFHSLETPASGDEDSPRARDALPDRGDADPVEAMDRKDTNRRVAEALGELDEEFRVVAVLRDVEGMDYARISHVLSIPIGTVKSRLYRARSMLQEKLRDLIA